MSDSGSGDAASDDTIRIFISSPGDVAQERVIAERVVERLQGEFARRADLDVIRWEREPLRSTEHFQEQITPPAETDISVFILWSRLGTPLPEDKFQKESGEQYRSGTEWEFENAVKSYQEKGTPDLLTYRKTKDPEARLSDEEDVQRRLEQKKALEEFIDRWFKGEEGESFQAAFHAFEEPAEFEQMLETHLRKLIEEHLPERAVEDSAGAAPEVRWHQGSPFRGLQPFEEEHAPIFFGRTEAVTGIIEGLERRAEADRPFVLVHGPSGTGKSSVVKAGVVPTLTRPGVIEGVGHWTKASVRPSDAPEDLTRGLAQALFRAVPALEETGFATEELADLLRNSPDQAASPLRAGLRNAAERVAEEEGLPKLPTARVLLTIDQLEEIFALGPVDAEKREQFAEATCGLVESGLVWTVATMRSDFFPRLSETEALRDLKQGEGNYDLDPPSFAELGRMIRGPVRAAGLRFEEDPDRGVGLGETLHEAAAEAPEALPLLEFTLEELYRRRTEEDVLTFEAYEELGGLTGAIAERAESTYEDLSPGVQAAFSGVMRELVTIEPGADNAVTSRRSALVELTDTPEKEALTDALVEARLLVTGQTDDGTAVVNVAHEALLRKWPRLRDWIERNRAFLRTRARVAERALRWDEEGRPEDLLLPTGQPLAEARGLLEEQKQALGDLLQTYVEQSIERAEWRERRRRRLIGGAVAAFVLVVAGFGLFSYQQWTEAAEQRNRLLYQKSEDLAAQARALVDSGRAMTGMLLALEALPKNMSAPDRPYVPEARSALYHAFIHNQEEAYFSSEGASFVQVALGPEGRYLATASEDKTVRIYDLERREETASREVSDTISDLAFTSSAARLVGRGNDNQYIWKVPSGDPVDEEDGDSQTLSLGGGPNPARSNLNYHVTAGSDGTVEVLKLPGARKINEFDSQLEEFILTEVRPERGRVVAVGKKGAQAWSMESTPGISEIGTSMPGVWALGPKGKYVARIDSQGRPHLASLDRPTQDRLLTTENGALGNFEVKAISDEYRYLAFGPDGDRLATSDSGSVAELWDVKSGDRLSTFKHSGPVGWLGIAESGQLITRIDTVWDPNPSRETLSSVILWDAEKNTRVTTIDSIQKGGFAYGNEVSCRVLPDRSAFLVVRDPMLTEKEKGSSTRPLSLREYTDSLLVQVRSSETGKVLSQFGDERRISQLKHVSSDGRYAFTETDSVAYVIGLEKGGHLATIETQWVKRPTFSPGGPYVAFLNSRDNAILYNFREGRAVDTLGRTSPGMSDKSSMGGPTDLGPTDFGPNGRKIVGTVVKSPMGMEGVKNRSFAWTFSESGAKLIADLGNGRAKFGPKGARLISMVGDDGEVRLFGAEEGTKEYMKQVARLQAPAAPFSSSLVRFTPHGRNIVMQTEDGMIRAWPVFESAQALIDTARIQATRKLTDAQREEFNLAPSE